MKMKVGIQLLLLVGVMLFTACHYFPDVTPVPVTIKGTIIVHLPSSDDKLLVKTDAIANTVAYSVYVYNPGISTTPFTTAIDPVPVGTESVQVLVPDGQYNVVAVAYGQSSGNGNHYILGSGQIAPVTVSSTTTSVSVKIVPLDFATSIVSQSRDNTTLHVVLSVQGKITDTLRMDAILWRVVSSNGTVLYTPSSHTPLIPTGVGYNDGATPGVCGPYSINVNLNIPTSSFNGVVTQCYLQVWGDEIGIYNGGWVPSNSFWLIPSANGFGYNNCPASYQSLFSLPLSGGVGVTVGW